MSSNNPPLHPAARPVVELISLLGTLGEQAARQAARATFRAIDRRKGHARIPGAPKSAPDESLTPMWDALAEGVRQELQVRGAKARLARHLGLPPQRISDFLQNRRLPDGEITLRILHWLAETRAGRDPSFLVPPDPAVFPAAAPGSAAAPSPDVTQ
jgi:hypothetical protein